MIITGLIFILAPLLGAFIGGPYIVMSWSIAATVGSIVLIASFGKDFRVSISAYFDKDMVLILVGLLAALVLSRIVSNIPALKNLQVILFCINSVVLLACLILPLYHSRTVQKIRSRFQLKYGNLGA